MSVITGVSPAAVHIQTPNQDIATQAKLLSDPEDKAFAPVEESNASSKSNNQPSEEPSRDSARQADRDLESDLGKLLKEARANNQQQAQDIESSIDFAGLKSKVSEAPIQTSDSPVREGVSQANAEQAQPNVPTRESQNDRERQAESQKEVESRVDSKQSELEMLRDQQIIANLKQRDREVKDHEQAHKAVGGQYAGAMSLEYERGPDGVNYAVAGEVQISLSRSADNPEADLIKAQQVRQAALAPAEPSSQDRAVAAAATQLALDAQERIRTEALASENKTAEDSSENKEVKESEDTVKESSSKVEQERAAASAERTKENLNDILEATKEASEKILEVHQIDEHRKTLGKLIDFEV